MSLKVQEIYKKGIKDNKDPYGMFEMVSRGRGDILSVFSFSPFNDNEVLTVEHTNKSMYILLKTGTLISWKAETQSANRKILEQKTRTRIPIQIKLQTSVIDIVCGKEHCIAKGLNNKIYSWGSNSFGQLGLSGFPMNPNSEKGEPTEILSLSNSKISLIYSKNNSSFAVTEDKKVYAWGSNEHGQFGIYEKKEILLKIPTPVLIYTDNIFEKEFTLFTDKKVKHIFFADLERPSTSLLEILELNRNKHLFSKEHELKDDIEKLKLKKNEIKNVKTTVKEYDTLINDIQNLTIKFEDKINDLELKNKKEYVGNNNIEQIKFYDTQIQFLVDKERAMEESIRKMDSHIDKSKLKIKTAVKNQTKNNDNNEIEDKSKVESNKIKNDTPNPLKNSSTDNSTLTQQDDINRLIKVEDIISRVNTELQFQKHTVLNDHLRLEEDIKTKNKQVKKLKEYIKTFDKAKDATNKKIELLLTRSSMSDITNSMEKIKGEMPNFLMNSLQKLTSLNSGDSDSILANLLKAKNNLSNLEEKVGNINIEQRNSVILEMNEMFNRNISLEKENNILMSKILKNSEGFYNNIFDKIIRNDNPPNFNELKAKIDTYKQNKDNEISRIDSDKEDDLKGVNSDESFNY